MSSRQYYASLGQYCASEVERRRLISIQTYEKNIERSCFDYAAFGNLTLKAT